MVDGRVYSRAVWADQILHKLQAILLGRDGSSTDIAIVSARAIARILSSSAAATIPGREQHFRAFAAGIMRRAMNVHSAHASTLLAVLGEVAEASDPESIAHVLNDETVEALLQLWSRRGDSAYLRAAAAARTAPTTRCRWTTRIRRACVTS